MPPVLHLKRNLARLIVACLLILVSVGAAPGQDEGRFFEETGQRLDNRYGFLQFWESHVGEELYGSPITGIVFEANVPVQYFERGRLEHRDGAVVPGELGRERARWRSFSAARPGPIGTRFFSDTRHNVSGAILDFWHAHDGGIVFGSPLSEAVWEHAGGGSVRVQYFERARLEQHGFGSHARVKVSPLGREIALARGLVRPAQRPAVAIISSSEGIDRGQSAFAPSPTPTQPPSEEPESEPASQAVPDLPSAPVAAGKAVLVDLSNQWLGAYEEGQLVYQAPVATGKDGFWTPTGTYDIYSKTEVQTMYGSMNGESWVVPDVPSVMYFTGDVALHGAYWHNLFGTGTRLSHGCVNLPLTDAAWLFDWAPVGTTVVVQE